MNFARALGNDPRSISTFHRAKAIRKIRPQGGTIQLPVHTLTGKYAVLELDQNGDLYLWSREPDYQGTLVVELMAEDSGTRALASLIAAHALTK